MHKVLPSASEKAATDQVDLANPRVKLDINLTKLQNNFRAIAAKVAPLQVMTVLKANAYGLGVRPIAEALVAAGSNRIGVAEVREALQILDLGVPVQILGGLIPEEIPLVVEAGIVAPVTDLRTAQLLSAEAQHQQREVDCHFLIDTGMGRLGIVEAEAFETIREVVRLPGLRCSGIYSHFPSAYGDYAYSYDQIESFKDLLAALAEENIHFELIHMANSDGINNLPETYLTPFNMVRTGINLYGVFDLEGKQQLDLQPIMTLKTRLVAVRQLKAGSFLGYGRTYELKRDMPVGTISIGYADGLPLAMSNAGYVIIRGRQCPIIGRMSMDYTTVSLENVEDPQPGDDVICLGERITVGEWAHIKKTHTYDIICSFGNRVKRIYIHDPM